MSKKLNIDSKRGIYVLLIIASIVIFVVIISIYKNDPNFDNDRINGQYSGTINIPNREEIQINITFDGMGRISGIMHFDNESYEFTNKEYICVGNQVQFSIYFIEDNESIDFVFLGDLSETAQLITGTVQLSFDYEDNEEGNFYFSLIS